jgi:dolichol-phosphate mannosyltransferase
MLESQCAYLRKSQKGILKNTVQMSQFETITIVIPTYNEAENLPILADRVFAMGISELTILVVDDNSPDGSGQVADDLHQKYGDRLQVIHRQRKEGLGRAYIQGLDHVLKEGASVVGMMDADLSHPPEKLNEMLSALRDADGVIGSRYVRGGGLDRDWPVWRKALSAFGNFYARTILNLPVKDATGGFKLWRRSALESIPFRESRSNGYVFQVEQAYLAKLAGLKMVEVPIYFAERKHGDSKMSFKIQKEAALQVWKLRRQYRDFPKQS